MKTWQSFEKGVAKAIRANSIVFLRRAANEIVSHDDTEDRAFDHETGTVVTVLTQMALELAIASFLVKHEGIRSIIEKPDGLSDEQIRDKWSENELRTKTFEEYKKVLSSKHSGALAVFDGVLDMFQKTRNKIMHLHFKFGEADLYDLKFEATYVLIHAVSHFIFENDLDHSHNVTQIVSRDTFQKLIDFPPYQYNVSSIAKDFSRAVLCCPVCKKRAFSDLELRCFSCTFEDALLQLLNCPSCSVRGVIYDHLNLPVNDKLPTLCLNCQDRREAFKCVSCGEATIGELSTKYCSLCVEDII